MTLFGAPGSETPTYLVPKMGEFAVSNTAFYTSLYITDLHLPDAELAPLEAQIDAFAELEGGGADTPATGVLLTHEQGWCQEGLALGTLLHSLCLAPGEVTKVAVVDWQRRAAARDEAATDQSEQVSASSDQALSTNEVQRSQARELQTGQSTTSSTSSQSSAGGNAGFLGWGVSGSSSLSTSLGHSASMSTGQRNLSAESSRSVSQRTEELAQSTRSRRSTQVREVSESETENVTTRVVANYNRQHAMTVQYYEVLQVYELRTRVAKAERCLFIPMKVIDFTLEEINRHRETLIGISAELGLEDMQTLLLDTKSGSDGRKARLTEAEECAARADQARKTALEALNDHKASPPNFANVFAEIKDPIRTALEFPQRIARWNARLAQLQGAYARSHAALVKAQAEVAKLKDVIGVEEAQLVQLLRRDRLRLNQLMWMRLDPYRVHRLLAGHSYEGKPLAGLVDPRPVGVFGNYVAFRWHFDNAEERSAFAKKYEQGGGDVVPTRVVLPSEGVFAEAVLGQSVAAEQIDITRFWDWGDNPIPILPPGIAPVALGSRARDVGTPDGSLEPSLAALPQLQALPGSDLGAMLAAIQAGGMFRNMSGIEQTAALARQTSEAASEGASEAAKTALEAQKAYADAMVKLANSEAGKAAMQLAMTAVPGGKTATVLGGLMNAGAAAVDAGGGDGSGAAPGKPSNGSGGGSSPRVPAGAGGKQVAGRKP